MRSVFRFFTIWGVVILAVVPCAIWAAAETGGTPTSGAEQSTDLEGSASFLGGKVEVKVRLNRTGFEVAKENRRASDEPGTRFSTKRRPGGGAARSATAAKGAPPVRFHVQLTNHDTKEISIELRRFDTAADRYRVTPPMNRIPALGTTTTEPIDPSREISATELPVTIELRVDGHRESQTLVLRRRMAAS